MEDELPPAGGVNVLGQALKANALLLKISHGGNQMGRERPNRSSLQTTNVSPARLKESAASKPSGGIGEDSAASCFLQGISLKRQEQTGRAPGPFT
jgi:hypothetical protein